MNKVQKTAIKVFTPEFLIFLESIPKEFRNEKKISTLVKEIDNQLHKKRICDCVMALSFYLTSIMVENEVDFNYIYDKLKDVEADIKVEKYIG